MFFEFLNEYTFIYRNTIKEGIVEIIRILTQRTIEEQEKCFQAGEKNNFVINQSWNVIRSVCETKEYIPEFLDPIEEVMKPLLEYAAKPDQIDFDDDIALMISS